MPSEEGRWNECSDLASLPSLKKDLAFCEGSCPYETKDGFRSELMCSSKECLCMCDQNCGRKLKKFCEDFFFNVVIDVALNRGKMLKDPGCILCKLHLKLCLLKMRPSFAFEEEEK